MHQPLPEPARSAARRASRRPIGLAWLALIGLACGAASAPDPGGPLAGWPSVGGDVGGTRHSPLTQITPENVGDLEVAWTYHTGDTVGVRPGAEKVAFQATPILRGDTLYLCSPLSKIVALDAETGEPHFTVRLPGISNVYASPVAAADRIYVFDRGGATVVLEHGTEFEVLAENEIDDGIDATPALVGRDMYLRSRRFLYAISEGAGPANAAGDGESETESTERR